MTTHVVERWPVCFDADGSEVTVTAHRLTGTPGPTVALFGPQHGDEGFTVQLMREAVSQLAGEELNGTVIVVPVCSPPALRDGLRSTQANADEPDMNRAWGGQNTWLANLLCDALDKYVLAEADALMDFHLGPAGSAFGAVCFGNDYPNPATTQRSRELTLAFGYPMVGEMAVCSRFPGPRSLAGYAGTARGIPSVLVEIGGAGHGRELERQWLDACLIGVRNVLTAMGILPGAPTVSPDTLLYQTARRINPRTGGLLIPADETLALGDRITAGQTLGTVYHPQTFAELEVLTSPADGYLMYLSRPRLVRPGDWAFGLIDDAGVQRLDHG